MVVRRLVCKSVGLLCLQFRAAPEWTAAALTRFLRFFENNTAVRFIPPPLSALAIITKRLIKGR